MNTKLICALIIGLLTVSCFPFTPSVDSIDTRQVAKSQVLPSYDGGYGYDADTLTMYDHNGFAYSYMPDGIIKLTLPWGYVTYFSFGLTGTYLGVAQKITALSYTWSWTVDAIECFNDTGVSSGFDYSFTATNSAILAWEITLDFYADASQTMKITHSITNGYPNSITNAEFWYLFDLTHTPVPSVTTHSGTYYPPLYSALPDSITWCRLSNQFQFDWRNAGYPNGHAYLGTGAIVGLSIDILGIGLMLGDIVAGSSISIDPYFSGVTRTWNAPADGSSGTDTNWSPVGVPATGDNITFDGTSDYNCNWISTAVVGNFSMTTGYDGTVTNAANWGAASIYIISGTFATGTGTQYLITIDGNQFVSGNRWTGYRASVTMTGASAKFYSSSTDHSVADLRVTTTGVTFTVNQLSVWRCMIIQSSITITSGVIRYISYYGGPYVFFNQATISATGSGAIRLEPNNNFDATLGTITAPLTFRNLLSSERIITMNASATCSTVSITTTSTGVMRLSTSSYSFSCTDLTILLNGAITQGTGTISVNSFTQSGTSSFIQGGNVGCTGIWTQTAGTFTGDSHTLTVGGNLAISGTSIFTSGTGEVVLSGTTKTINTSPFDSFYDLTVSGSYTTTSTVNISHDLSVTGTLTIGASKGIDWNTSTDGTYSNAGTITGDGTLYLTLQNDYTLTLGTVESSTIIRRAVGVSGTQTITLSIDTSLQSDFTVETGVILDPNDKVVTFVSDMDLSLSADSTLWNCTIEIGVTLNLLTDVNVEVRATIDGTITGESLIQPDPRFTSDPDGLASVFEYYSYPITQAYWDTFSVVDAPTWMYYSNGAMVGTPSTTDIGVHNVSLSLTWEGVTTYQNFTVFVEPEPPYMAFDFFFLFIIQILFVCLNVIGFVATETRIMGLFIIFGEAILCIPTILAFESYYWVAILFVLMNTVLAIQSARINAKQS